MAGEQDPELGPNMHGFRDPRGSPLVRHIGTVLKRVDGDFLDRSEVISFQMQNNAEM